MNGLPSIQRITKLANELSERPQKMPAQFKLGGYISS